MTLSIRRCFALACLVAGVACTQPSQDVQAMKEVHDASEAARARASAQLAAGETVDVTAEAARLRKSVDDAVAGASGNQAALLRATSKILGAMQDAAVQHHQVLQAYLDAGGIDPEGMTSSADVAARRRSLEDFCASNEELQLSLAGMPEEYGRLARAEGATEASAAAATEGFLVGFPHESLLRMRKLDAGFCASARAQLDILAAQAGRWQVDATHGLVFDETVSEAVVTTYNAATEEITRIGAEQETLQRKMIALKLVSRRT